MQFVLQTLFCTLVTPCLAQSQEVNYTTQGGLSTDHARPVYWQQFHDGVIHVEGVAIVIDYDVTVTNSGSVPEVITFMSKLGPYPGIVGGQTFFGECWGTDPYASTHWYPLYHIPVSDPLLVSPNESTSFTGQESYASFDEFYQTDLCQDSDGVHEANGFIYAWPRVSLGFAQWQVSTMGGGTMQIEDHGSIVTSHDYKISTQYDLPQLGGTTCTPLHPNSNNTLGKLEAFGSIDTTTEQHIAFLVASDLPPNRFGYFLMSEASQSPALLAGGPGTLCLGSPLYRWHASLGYTSDQGKMQRLITSEEMPIPGGRVELGDTWHFQFWHRDFGASGPSNTTNAVGITYL